MKIWMGLFLILVFVSCSKKDGEVSNSATRYTKSLQNNLEKSREAAEKAKKAIEATNKRIDKSMKLD